MDSDYQDHSDVFGDSPAMNLGLAKHCTNAPRSMATHTPAIGAGVVLTGIALGWLASRDVTIAALAGGALFALLVAYLLRRHILVALLLFVVFVPGQTAPGSALDSVPAVRWAGLLLVPVVALALAGSLVRGRRHSVPGRYLLLVAGFGGILILSGLLNGSSALDTAASLLLYLRYPVLFLVLIARGVSDREGREIVACLTIVTAVVVVESVARYGVSGARYDTISVLLGSYGTFPLGAYCLYVMCLLSARVTQGLLRLRWLLLLPLLLLPALLGEIKALLLFAPVCTAAVFLRPIMVRGTGAARLVGLGLVSAVFVVLLISWAGFWRNNDTLGRVVTQVQAVTENPTSTEAYGQIDRLRWTLDAAQALGERDQLAAGSGPGSSLAGNATGRVGALNELRGLGVTQVNAVMWDVGLLGLALYLALLICIWREAWNNSRTERRLWGTDRGAVCLALVGICLYFTILGPQYDLVWRAEGPACAFWLLAAYGLSRSRMLQRPSDRSDHVEPALLDRVDET